MFQAKKKTVLTRIGAIALLILLLLPLFAIETAAADVEVDGPTVFCADDFTVLSGVPLKLTDMDDGSILIERTKKWTTPLSVKHEFSITVLVDLDETPVIFLNMGICGNQYDAFYTLLGKNEMHYLNSRDEADWRYGGAYKINLCEAHGWSGKVRIKITFEYILYNMPAESADKCSLTINSFGFTGDQHFSLPTYIGSGMIFQQNAPICVPGTGDPGTQISATLTDKSGKAENAKAVIDSDGNFLLEFSPRTGGYDAYTLSVSDGSSTVTLRDILVGEVWLTSGQSNMEYKLRWTFEGNEMTEEDADDPYLRCICFPTDSSWASADNLLGLMQFNAVGYYYAKELREKLNIPVGIIDTAKGSTSIYHWLSEDVYAANKTVKSYASSTGVSLSQWYNDRIAPLAGFRIKGLVWYQGEANVGNSKGYYTKALTLLRDSWGELFGFEPNQMPLIVSHLAPYSYPNLSLSALSNFEAEISAAVTGMEGPVAQVAIYDLTTEYETTAAGASVDPIHPAHKEDVGVRLARAALGLVYNAASDSTAPVLRSYEVKDGAVYLTFDHVGNGLISSDGSTLRGFTICGSDNVFLPADAKIVSKDTVRVTSDYVKEPFAAAYAFTAFNASSNLASSYQNSTWLMAVPFYTSNCKAPKFFAAHDWMYCESATQWRAAPKAAGYKNTWSVKNGKISFTSDAFGGLAALEIDYTAAQDGTFSVAPILETSFGSNDCDSNYSNYNAVLLHLKSESSVKLKAIVFNSTEVPVNAEIGKDWTTVNVDISSVKSKTNVKEIRFVFEATPESTGTVLMDEISFGTKAGAYAPYVEPTSTPTPTEEVTGTPTSIDGPSAGGESSSLVPILLCVVLVLVIGGGVAFFLLKKKK